MRPITAGHSRQGVSLLEQLETLRDRTFRRLPVLRVHGPARALRFINEVGLASLFATRGVNLPCLWVAVCGRRDPQFPHHSHHDPEVALAWNLKDQLPAEGKVFYAKLVRGKPTFVAWDIFPCVYRLLGPQHDYIRQYRDGLLSPAAKAILDALHRKRPQETFELKLATNCARPSQRRVFDAAMAEVQQQLYVAMREVRYDPFTYVWDLVEARYPEPVARSRECSQRQAAYRLAQRYFASVIYATIAQLASVLGDRSLAQSALVSLVRDGVVDADCTVEGLRGRWLVVSASTRERLKPNAA